MVCGDYPIHGAIVGYRPELGVASIPAVNSHACVRCVHTLVPLFSFSTEPTGLWAYANILNEDCTFGFVFESAWTHS